MASKEGIIFQCIDIKKTNTKEKNLVSTMNEVMAKLKLLHKPFYSFNIMIFLRDLPYSRLLCSLLWILTNFEGAKTPRRGFSFFNFSKFQKMTKTPCPDTSVTNAPPPHMGTTP